MIRGAMRIEAIVRDPPLNHLPSLVQRLEQLGFDGVAIPEVKRDPFVVAAAVASASRTLRLSTAVALAFPRSPTSAAYSARSLHDLSGGRFVLGLGSQVRGHIERRFGVPWSAPVERLRDYIGAVRAVWRSWETGEPPQFDSQHYRISLMTPDFSPGPSEHAPVPIHIGAVNVNMLRLAAQTCDGVRLHPFCTSRYFSDVVLHTLKQGASSAGRSLNSLEIIGGGFIAAGASDESVAAARESIRRQIAFYASTRGYAPVLDLHGWAGLGGELRRLIAEQRWAELGSLVTDEMLDAFCVAGTYDRIGRIVRERHGGQVDTLTLNVPADESHDDQLAQLVSELRAIPARQTGA
jgi:probable F420-dependent oxidoreductase